MTQRLPNPGADSGDWGDILNSFLEVSLASDGTLNNNTVGTNQLQSGSVTNLQLDSPTQSAIASITTYYTKPSSGIPLSDLVSSVQSVLESTSNAVQVGGDIGGTNTSPSVIKIKGISLPASSPTAAGQVLTASSSSTTTWTTPAGGVTLDNMANDIQPLGAESAGSTGKAADAGHVHAMPSLNQVNQPTSAVTLNSQKITNLANGSVASDAATFGQIPNVSTTSLGGDLSGSIGNATVSKIDGIAVSGTPSNGQTIIASSASAASWSDLPSGNGLGNVALSGTPTSGQVPTATSATSATWQTPSEETSMVSNFSQNGSFTLSLNQANEVGIVSPTANATATIPQYSSVAFPVGTIIGFVNNSSYALNITPTSGVTLESPGGTTGSATLESYGSTAIFNTGTDSWIVLGG